jgi:putative phosphoribosyl transferase
MAARSPEPAQAARRELLLEIGGVVLAGDLTLPPRAPGLVIFAHGSGSSRLSPRNREVAGVLNRAGMGTLLFDLLTDQEGRDHERVFDIPLLARRLEEVTRWAIAQTEVSALGVAYFGASTGAAAALRAAAHAGEDVKALVSRGGRPDLAADDLPSVSAATLLLVGSRDPDVFELNRDAAARLRCQHELVVVAGATHLFTEPGALETVARLAADWFAAHFAPAGQESDA